MQKSPADRYWVGKQGDRKNKTAIQDEGNMGIQKRKNWLFLMILIISLAGMIYSGTRKEGYHVDEMYSYGLANSEYLPFMHFGESGYDVKDWMLEYGAGESFADLIRNLKKDYKILKEYHFQFYNTPIYEEYRIAQKNSSDTRTTTWVSGQEYMDYLCVSESNTFNYASVYYNQRGDVHPPFYYMILHTICSVFQGTFSKWYAMSINIVFLLVTLWVLYRMADKYLGGENVALAVTAVYGLSNGLFTTAMYLRMYAVLTCMTMICCYVHLKIQSEGFSFKKRNVFYLMIVTFLGYMTHYYYVIYAIAVAIVFAVWMCIGRKWRSLIQYISTLMGTALIGICIWPFSLKHVFLGYRGQSSLGVITNGEFYWIRVKLILDQTFNELFGGRWWIPIVCLLLLITTIFCEKKRWKMGMLFLIFVPMLVYIVVVAQIVPFYVDWYVMCMFPFWCLAFTLGVWWSVKGLRNIFAGSQWKMVSKGIFIGVTVFVICMNNGFWHTPGYLYTGGQENIIVPENAHCVYVLPDGDWNESAEDTLMLSKCEQVAVVYYSQLSRLANTYQFKEGDCVIIALHKALNREAALKEVKKVLEITEMQKAFEVDSYNTVKLYYQ